MKERIVQAATSVAAKVGPKISKASPEILLGAGIAGIVGGVVLACRATLKAKEKVDGHLDKVDELVGEEASQTEIRKAHVLCAIDVAKSYALPTLVLGTGVACIIVSHNIQSKRILAAMGALDALQLSFDQYRRNVIADQGPSADIRYMTGDKIEKAEFYEEDESGKLKKVKREVRVRSGCADPYVKLFDDCNSSEWRAQRGWNLDFLQNQEVFFNRVLRMKGHVFLNEVYEALGFEYEPIGQFVGWMIDGDGDGHIVFEVEECFLPEELALAKEQKRNPEPSFWVTFNVDGEIWDKV